MSSQRRWAAPCCRSECPARRAIHLGCWRAACRAHLLRTQCGSSKRANHQPIGKPDTFLCDIVYVVRLWSKRSKHTESACEDVGVPRDLAPSHSLRQRLESHFHMLKRKVGTGELQSRRSWLRLGQGKLLLRCGSPVQIEGCVEGINSRCGVVERQAQRVLEVQHLRRHSSLRVRNCGRKRCKESHPLTLTAMCAPSATEAPAPPGPSLLWQAHSHRHACAGD